MRFPDDVLAVLTDPRTVIADDRVTTPFDYASTTWASLNTILREMGGRYRSRKSGHVFPHRIADHLRQCLAAGEYPTKYEQGWFPTPTSLVTQVLDLAGIRAGKTVLEPSAGGGAFTSQIVQRGGVVDAVELDARRANLLREQGDCRTVTHASFLDLDPLDQPEGYDRVVMNPPFTGGLDHIRHAIGFMSDDAVLVSVMSEGLMWWSDKATAEFRQLVSDVDGEIESLPDDTFAASGTNVRTCLLYLPSAPGSPLRTHEWHQAQPRQLDLFAA
ncbi:class I SAM-dependent methyltransferase [Streptomyces sp. NPDC056708]|uniref:class I SAM-dependent methyltransferase n=1 Tax=unclassified Streptomyces TaxID=2593676 RepID=UPI00368A4D09